MDENKLSEIINNLTDKGTLNVELYFTKKTKKNYITYKPNVDDNIKDDIIELIIRYLNKHLSFKPVKYSPTKAPKTNEFSYCDLDYVGNFDEVIKSFAQPDTVDTNLKPSEITFYCLEITNRQESFNYKFFRRITKFKTLSKEGFLSWFSGNTLRKLNEQTFGIDGLIDLVCFNNQIYILNNIALERIFRLSEQFATKATTALSVIKKANVIANFEEFEEDCLSSAKINRILCKILDNNPNLGRGFDNFDNVKTVINTFELDIEINSMPPQLIYENKSQIEPILNIINDAYCKSCINDRNLVYDD